MLKWNIRNKLILGFGVIVFFMIINFLVSRYSINRAVNIERMSLISSDLQINLLQCRREEKNIIIRGLLPEHLKKWKESFNNIDVISYKLKFSGYISLQDFKEFRAALQKYQQIFDFFIQDLRIQKVLTTEELESYDGKFLLTGRKILGFGDIIIQNSIKMKNKLEKETILFLFSISFFGILSSILLGYVVTFVIQRSVRKNEALTEELEDTSLELSVGVSEFFEVLRRISEGDLNVKARVDSKNELLAELGVVINQTIKRFIELTRMELEQFSELIGSGIRIIDKEYNCIRANRAMGVLCGFAKEEMLGKKCYEQLPGPFCHTDNCTLKQILQGKEKVEIEVERKLLDGTVVPCLLRAVPFRDSSGNIVGIIEDFRDIVELKKLQTELENTGLELAIGLSKSYEMVNKLCLGDPSVRIEIGSSNELLIKLETMLNQLAENMQQMVDVEHELAMGLCEHYDALNSISAGDLNIRASESSGNELISQLGKLINKQVSTLIGLLDESARSEARLMNTYEELKITQSQLVQSSKMAAVGQLASGVAHEINNPLTGVLNNVQLIKMEAAEKKEFLLEDFKELLNVVEESALRCKNIVKSLLDFSYASEGFSQEISLNEIVEKVTKLISHEMNLQNVFIKQELEPDLPQVKGDSQLLQQIIFNLVSNAKWAIQKKSDKEGGVITIKTFYNRRDNYVCISVTDTGIGIPKEDLDRIFEPFFSTKPVGEGTGLGLSLVYNVIKQHKGNIEVESVRGKGTTFKINIPVVLGK